MEGKAPKSPAATLLKDIGEAWQRTVVQLAKSIGQPLLSHGPLAIALSGIGLYVIGVVRTVGILRAEDIPFSRGLPIVQLQDYLLRGMSVLARPQLLFGLTILLLIVTLLLAMGNLRAEKGIPAGSAAPLVLPFLAFMGIGVALIPVAEWASLVPGVVIGITCLVKLDRGAQEGKSRTAALLTLGVFFGFALSMGTRAFFAPPPLDRAVITEVSGDVREGRLLYQSGSALYLAGGMDPENGHRLVEVLPTSSLTSVLVKDGEKRHLKTAPEMLGWSFYRLWEDDNSELHFEPSPKDQ